MPAWHLRHARQIIAAGGIVAYPTEAVWGLGCDPLLESAVDRLLAIKHRPRTLGLIVIAASFDQIEPFIDPAAGAAVARARRAWPGPGTWLLPAAPTVPEWIRGRHHSVALRVTAHPIAAGLCMAAGRALVSTSANIHGRPPPRSALQVRRQLGAQIDYVVPGEVGDLDAPTPITDAVTGHVIRRGPPG